MATDVPALGTQLAIKLATVFTSIGQKVEIGDHDPEVKLRTVDGIDYPKIKKRSANVDLGTLEVTAYFDPNDTTICTVLQARCLAAQAAVDEFKLTYADGLGTHASDDFFGVITGFKRSHGGPTDTLKYVLTIEITDSYTPTQGV